MSSQRLTATAAAALVALAFVLFLPALGFDFVLWDDDINVTQNPHVRSGEWGAAEWAWMFGNTEQTLRYKPLSWLAWKLVYEAGGLWPAAFHLANVLLHAFNAVLVFLIAARLFAGVAAGRGEVPPGLVVGGAWFAAALWAVHPQRVEPVAWVTGLPYCLATALLLGSFWFYLRASTPAGETGRPPAPRRDYGAAVAAFVLSLLTYPVGLTYPFALVVFDLVAGRAGAGAGAGMGVVALLDPRRRETRRYWAAKLPFFLPALALAGITVWGRIHRHGFYTGAVSLEQFGPFERLMQAAYGWVYFLLKPLWPDDLAPVYTQLIEFDPLSAPFVLAALWVGLTAVAVPLLWRWRPGRWAGGAYAAFLVLLVPFLGLTERPHFPSDRYSYVPGVVWCLGLGALVVAGLALWPRSRLPGLAAGVVLLAAAATASRSQMAIWRDSFALLDHLGAHLADHRNFSAKVHSLRGRIYFDAGQYPLAVAEYSEALADFPTYPEYLRRRGLARFFLRQDAGALEDLKLLREVTGDPGPTLLIAQLLLRTGDYPGALAESQRFLESNPGDPGGRVEHLSALAQTGRADEARAGFEALQTELGNALPAPLEAYFLRHLAEALERAGRAEEARQVRERTARPGGR